MPHTPKLGVTFYRTKSGNDVVVEWFRALHKEDRKHIGLDLLRVQENWPVGMPVCRALGQGLWEVRSNLPSNRIGRIMFFMDNAEIHVVHAFIKKSQATPKQDLELARKRMKELQK